MPEPAAYRRKPTKATALQWTGPDTADDMTAFIGADFMYDPEAVDDDVAALCLSKHSNWVSLYAGEWAVRGEDGSLFKLDADDFAAQFESAATPATPPGPDYLPGCPGKSAKPPAGLFERAERAEITAERIATYYLDHCGNCRDAEFYGATGRQADRLHERHVPVIEDGHGPLAGQPCACKTCVPPAPGGSTAPILDPAERRTPEEWCEAYGLTVLDPDGWRVPGAPAWMDPVGLAEFYHRAVESTTNCAVTGAFTRIKADLDAWAADHA